MNKSVSIENRDNQVTTTLNPIQCLGVSEVLDLMPCAVFTVANDQTITSWNREAEKITGYRAQEMLGQRCTFFARNPCQSGCKLFGSDSAEPAFEKECQIRHKNGQILTVSKNTQVLRDRTGAVIGGLESFFDITHKKTVHAQLSDSEMRFRQLFANMPSSVAVFEPTADGQDFVFVDFNRAAQDLEGVTRESLLGRRVTEAFPGVEAFGLLDVLKRVNTTGAPEHVPINIYTDERTGPVHRENYVYKLPNGNIVAIYKDVTEEVRTQEELHRHRENLERRVAERTADLRHAMNQHIQSESRFRALTQNMSSAIADHEIVLDESGKPIDYIFRHANPTFEEFTGLRVQDILNRRVTEVVPGIAHFEPNLIELYGQVALTGKSQTLQLYFEPINRWFEIRAYATRPKHFAALFADITEKKTAERKLAELNHTLEARVLKRTRQLEALNQELESFAYSVSHDLRAPLRAIDGFSKAVLEDQASQLSEDGRGFLKRVCGASQRMANLIDDLLKLSRLTLQAFERQPVDLGAIANRIVHELQETEPEREVNTRIAEQLLVEGDRALLQVALHNLLCNAWKFTSKQKKSTIELGTFRKDQEQVYYVRDNGAGFDMKYAKNLFSPFQRLHRGDEFPGNGVGLATVKRVINRHGGRIWAQSQPDRGATFYFVLAQNGRDRSSMDKETQ